MKSFRSTFSVLIAASAALIFVLAPSSGRAQGLPGGVHLTASGYRVPVYGMAFARDAAGRLGTECVRLGAPAIESLRLGRTVSRVMAALAPRSTVQSTHEVAPVVPATFQVLYTDPEGSGFNDPQVGETRRRALEASLSAWSKVLQGTIPIVIQARMETPEDPASTTLASAGPVDLVEHEGRVLPSALASQILNRETKTEAVADIEMVYNATVAWDYAVDGIAAAETISFVYVTLHEIGHGLGFLDSFDRETGRPLNPLPFPYDTFINRGFDIRNVLIERPAEEVVRDLLSNDLFFSGPKATEASLRSIRQLPMVKLYAPDPYEQGSSISHVDQDTYADIQVGLMTPRDFGAGSDTIDILTLGVMQDLGYTLVPQVIAAPTPGSR